MIIPALADDELLADIRQALNDPTHLQLWWLGQSGFLLHYQQRFLLMDPYLSDSLTEKYAGTDKPHVRMTQRAIDPARLDFVDVVTSSHHHTDHLDAATLQPVLRANPEVAIIVPAAHEALACQRLQVPAQRLTLVDDGQKVEVSRFALHAVPAAHETVERDEQGRCRFLGYVVQAGPWTVYHSGDTLRYEGLVERLRPFAVDVALLPINGRLASRGVPGNLWGQEAAQLAHDIRARCAIPCHYEMFEFNTVTPDEFVHAARTRNQPYAVLRCGQRWSTDQLL